MKMKTLAIVFCFMVIISQANCFLFGKVACLTACTAAFVVCTGGSVGTAVAACVATYEGCRGLCLLIPF